MKPDPVYPYTDEPPLTPDERTYIEAKIAIAIDRLNWGAEGMAPRSIIGLMSGGDDSAPACYIASLHPLFGGVVHVNTGIGVPQTRDHVRATCELMGWPLTVMNAADYVDAKGNPQPAIYEEIVKYMGFPGPAQHGLMYQRLKERQLQMFERQQGFGPKPGDRVMYASGIRQQESARRKKNTSGEPQREGRVVWAAPIFDWSKKDCNLCRRYAGMRRNPVAELIHKSGECLCGSFAEEGELAELEVWFPCVAKRIKDLQAEVRAAGFPWGWEEEPPASWMEHRQDLAAGQELMMAPQYYTDPEAQHLCTQCNVGHHYKTELQKALRAKTTS